MAQDQTSLFNLALSAAGSRSSISLPSEQSREAEICRQWYEPVRRQVLRSAPWSSVKAFARLAELKERTTEEWVEGDPNPAFSRAFALPELYLHARYLSNYARFELSLLEPDVKALMTSDTTPILYYTLDQTQISLWESDLYLAMAQALGAFICLPLNGKSATAQRAQQQANALIYAAREAAANESFEPVDMAPEWIAGRGSIYGSPGVRYIYPSGPLIAVPNV